MPELDGSDPRFRALVEHIPDAVFLHDLDGRIVDVNRYASESSGYSREELLAMSVADLDTNVDPEVWRRRHWEVLPPGQTVTGESLARRKDGTVFPVEVRIGLLDEGPQRRILALVRDITTRRKAEQIQEAHVQFLEHLERVDREIRQADDLEQMMRNVLDAVLDVFDCDRAWLLYPCDPEASSWRVPMERTRPDFPGAFQDAAELPMTPDISENTRRLLDTNDPVTQDFAPGEAGWDPEDRYQVRSLIAIAIRPKVGPPWQFGLHQCSRPRTWTEAERRLFKEISRRVADGLGMLLSFRDLSQSEERYRAVFEQAAETIVLLEPGTGEILQFNARTHENLGYTREEFEKLRLSDFEATQSEATIRQNLAAITEHGSVNFETTHRTKTGEIRNVMVSARMVGLQGRQMIVCIGHDVTDQRRAEQQRQAHLRFLESLERVDRALRGATDLEQMLRDAMETVFSIFDCDRAWLLHPCDPDAATFRVPIEVNRPEYPGAGVLNLEVPMTPATARDCRDGLEADGPVTYGPGHDRSVSKDTASRFDVQAQMFMAIYPKVGQPWLVGLHQCTHARVWTEQEQHLFKEIGRRVADGLSTLLTLRDLRDSQATMSSILLAAPMGIGLTRSPARVMIWANEQMTKLTGYTPEEFTGQTARILYASDKEYRRVGRVLAEGMDDSGIGTAETRLVRRNGSRFNAFLCSARLDPADPTSDVVVMVSDVTEQRSAEQTRERLEAQLRQAQKMEAVGQLAGGVAHDFNNILTAIQGNVELALDEVRTSLPDSRQAGSSLEQIQHATQRAASLTRQLLVFSRRDVTRPSLVDLNRVLADLEKMLRRLIAENIQFSTRQAADLHQVVIDGSQLEQVIINLVVNARDAMPDGGRLALETTNVELDETHAAMHADAQPGRHVMLSVGDTGYGMEAATVARVFEPFFTTKPRERGTGLGLSTVYGIVTRAGGHITVDSEPGEGTTFRVFLPAAGASTPVAQGKVEDRRAPTGSETILVCEDDSDVRHLAAQMLQEAGYTVIVAKDGHEALELYARQADPVDLLVTDVIMPGINGRQLADALVERQPTIRTLFISGYASGIVAERGVLDENVDLLEKPFSRWALLRRVREVLDRP